MEIKVLGKEIKVTEAKTIRLENLLYICEALGTNLSKFFADERFNEAEAQNWLKRNKEK